MKVEEVERLLAKFYEGSTTESEEEGLKSFFRTEEVPEYLLRDKNFFLSIYSTCEVEMEVPVGLEDKLNLLIDSKAEEEQRFFHRNKSKWNWRWVGGVAATVLLLIGIGYGVGNFHEDLRLPTPQDTFSDPKEAYEVLQATLTEVSANLNSGLCQVRETQQDMKEVNKEIRNEIKR